MPDIHHAEAQINFVKRLKWFSIGGCCVNASAVQRRFSLVTWLCVHWIETDPKLFRWYWKDFHYGAKILNRDLSMQRFGQKLSKDSIARCWIAEKSAEHYGIPFGYYSIKCRAVYKLRRLSDNTSNERIHLKRISFHWTGKIMQASGMNHIDVYSVSNVHRGWTLNCWIVGWNKL